MTILSDAKIILAPIAAVDPIHALLYESYGTRSLSTKTIANHIRSSKPILLGVYPKNKLQFEIAAAAVVARHRDRLEIKYLAVREGHRRKGWSRLVVDKLSEHSDRVTVVLRETNELAIKVAVGLGFQAVRLVKSKFDSEDGIEFELEQ